MARKTEQVNFWLAASQNTPAIVSRQCWIVPTIEWIKYHFCVNHQHGRGEKQRVVHVEHV